MQGSLNCDLAHMLEVFEEPAGDGQNSRNQAVTSQEHSPVPGVSTPLTNTWWVNQGNTFDQARRDGHIFAPFEDKLGRQPVHWKTVSEVEAGDVFVHCVGGQIRALGRATSSPIADSRPVETTDPSVPEWKQTGRRVDIDYFDLVPPISVGAIANKIRDLNIPQGPFSVDGGLKQGYLFRFNASGLKILRGASETEWPPWAETVLSAAPTYLEKAGDRRTKDSETRFPSLLQKLELGGLHFSEETVSNYLLALQTKRFVILTGISGTGKTQLALRVADHFRQSVKLPHATQLPEGALVRTVEPYMLKHRNMVLPTSFTANLVDPPTGRFADSRQIRVHYPRDEQTLTMSKDADRNVINLFFKGRFRTWFNETLDVGDQFAIELLDSEDGTSEALRFHVPTVVLRTELLENYLVTAVRPDWSDNRGLLGYFNPLIGSYVLTPFLRLLLDAHAEVDRADRERRAPAPFFVILDEMNLARVEHYFSDFLSALESGEPIDLHDHSGIEEGETEDAVPVPRQLRVPENVFFTGTVNVDETTYMFSPKVLDRAFTIELNRVDLASFGAEQQSPETSFTLNRFSGLLGAARKPCADDWVAFGDLMDGELRQVVLDIHTLLSAEDRHFGYRVANEIARFVVLASEQTDGSDDALWTALDLALLEKVLPKFHGTQQELEAVLTHLSNFVETKALPRTAAKIQSMQRRLKRQGFTSFIE